MSSWIELAKTATRLQSEYPSGTRVVLEYMGDDPRPVQPGTKGTVDFVDDIGTVFVKFDNGRCIGLLYGVDKYRKLNSEKDMEEIN